MKLYAVFSKGALGNCLTRLTQYPPLGTTGLNDWRHLLQRIRSHESSTHHAEACVIHEQWRNRGTIEEALHESFLEKQTFGKMFWKD